MEINVLIGKHVRESDKDLFFQAEDEDIFKEFPDETKYPQLLKELGIFKSTSEARRMGWDKEIKEGFEDFKIGKMKTRITILKITCNNKYLEEECTHKEE
mgnify:CR=1 FL=1